MNKCLYCGKPVKNKYCNVSCENRHLNPLRTKKIKKKNICLFCGKETYNIKFCSKSCSSRYTHQHMSHETRLEINRKISESCTGKMYPERRKLKKVDKNKTKKKNTLTCKICGAEILNSGAITCSIECRKKAFRLGGMASALSQNRRSKNEILFYLLCKKVFKKISHNERAFNGWDADILIYDLNIAILWNGAWHYKQISKKSSLKQIQMRDKIKIKEIQKAKWKVYIIKDMGKFNKEFVLKQFIQFKSFVSAIKQ